MPDELIDFGLGLLTGGLLMSAGWGLFWLGVGAVGWSRGSTDRRALLNAAVVATAPLLLVTAVWYLRRGLPVSSLPWGLGLTVIPMLLFGLSMRQAPDGQRAGVHMLGGVRHLMDEMLGRHRSCGGCDHDHGGPGGCA